jgi:hypothetical protein
MRRAAKQLFRFQPEFQILLNLLEAFIDLIHNDQCYNRDRQIYKAKG